MSDQAKKLYPVKMLRHAERPNAIFYPGSVYGFSAEEAAKLIKIGAALAWKEGEAEATWSDFPEELLHEKPEPAPAPVAPPAEQPVKLEAPKDPNVQPAEKPEPAKPVSVAEVRENSGVLPSGPDAPAPKPTPTAPSSAPTRRRR